MKIALIQTHLIWENPSVNRIHLQHKINNIIDPIDLIILPEMFTTGFTMQPENQAETMHGETIPWMIHNAKTKHCAILGSIIIQENNQYYNRLLFVFPSGTLQYYDKKHLFTLAGEDKKYSSGNKRLIVDYMGYKICPLICYDLRFPVWSRNTIDYDILIYVANWPQTRIDAWNTLLRARAIENMSYVIGVNRIGEDKNNNIYSGNSKVIDYLGNVLIDANHQEDHFIIALDKSKMVDARNKMNFLKDQDSFSLEGVL